MNDRNKIINDWIDAKKFDSIDMSSDQAFLILEVLLDIRDLLKEKKTPQTPKEKKNEI